MIQKKRASKQKTIISLTVIVLMFGGMLWMLLGPSSSPSEDSFIPSESEIERTAVPTAVKLDENLFQDPRFVELIPQGGMAPLDSARIGRANPFVPVQAKP